MALVVLSSFAIAQDMPLSQVLIDGEDWELVADGFKYTEGPAVDGRCELYLSDVPNSTIHKLDGNGSNYN
jgi:sugar lactone lactonase YvrE